jgi:hypothetical protein
MGSDMPVQDFDQCRGGYWLGLGRARYDRFDKRPRGMCFTDMRLPNCGEKIRRCIGAAQQVFREVDPESAFQPLKQLGPPEAIDPEIAFERRLQIDANRPTAARMQVKDEIPYDQEDFFRGRTAPRGIGHLFAVGFWTKVSTIGRGRIHTVGLPRWVPLCNGTTEAVHELASTLRVPTAKRAAAALKSVFLYCCSASASLTWVKRSVRRTRIFKSVAAFRLSMRLAAVGCRNIDIGCACRVVVL